MRYLLLMLASSFVLSSQVTVPLPNPYGQSPTALRPHSGSTSSSQSAHGIRTLRRPRGYVGGGYIGNSTHETVVVETAVPEKEDKLKELIVSPTYQKETITPKLIEIP